jgi:predicted 3-demethylubiquinone-9 3-methyltransferase (glyoxalase superfamily)
MARTQKITTYLWFNGNAEEAVEFYTSVFPRRLAAITQRYR